MMAALLLGMVCGTSALIGADVTYDPNGGRATVLAVGEYHTAALQADGTVVAWGNATFGQTAVPSGLADGVALAAGGLHTLALRHDGTVAAWGNNTYGQTTVPPGLTGVVAIGAGYYHSLALRSDGTVVGWGYNGVGQAIPPASLCGVVSISVGGETSMALRGDGTVVVWGNNTYGQASIPDGLHGVIAVASGRTHLVALQDDGTIVAWGDNTYGQTDVPPGLSDVVAIAAGAFHTVALRADGTMVAWGDNHAGQITIPAGLAGVVAVAAGGSHSVALCHDGRVVAWGANTYGQTTVPSGLTLMSQQAAPGESLSLVLGQCHRPGYILQGWNTAVDGSGTSYPIGGAYAADASATLYAQWSPHAVVLSYDAHGGAGAIPAWSVPLGWTIPVSGGTALSRPGQIITCWNTAADGSGEEVALGSRYQVTVPTTLYAQWGYPVHYDVHGARPHVLAAGLQHTVALGADQSVVVWGNTTYGQADVPMGLSGAIEVVAGGGTTAALTYDGTVVAWGLNSFGQANVPSDLHDVVAIAAGALHMVAVRGDGTVVAWGHQTYGQTTVPTGLQDVVAIAAGAFHTLAVRADGTVMAWGLNNRGQSTVPAGLTAVRSLAAGSVHSLALRHAGDVLAWGDNTYGQLNVPADVGHVVAIAAGAHHCLALRDDGTVVAWGLNTFGQATVPAGLGDVVAIAAGGDHSVALRGDGFIVGWGFNTYHQLRVPEGLLVLTQRKRPGHALTLSLGMFGRPGALHGWNTAADGTGTSYATGGVYADDAAVQLYARWADATVSYDPHGGTGSIASDTKVCGIDLLVSDGSGLSREGFDFGGWNTAADGGGVFYAGHGVYRNDVAVTLYAQWVPHAWVIAYAPNGGSGSIPSATKLYDVDLTLSDGGTFSRVGYTVNSWNTMADGSGTTYALSGSYQSNAAVTLYAQWVPQTYPVVYQSHGGMGSVPSSTKTYGVDLIVSSGAGLSRSGYIFQGWNTAVDGSGIWYAGGAVYALNEPLTVYALWTADGGVQTEAQATNGGAGCASGVCAVLIVFSCAGVRLRRRKGSHAVACRIGPGVCQRSGLHSCRCDPMMSHGAMASTMTDEDAR